jgi:hypothetical protein
MLEFPPLLIFPVTSGIALAMALIAWHISWHPLTRILPSYLIHRWTMGIFCAAALYIGFALPFFVIGEYIVAVVSLIPISLILLFWGRPFLIWIVDDLRNHRREKRSAFKHSNKCVLNKQ